MPALSINDLYRAWLIDQLGLSQAQGNTYSLGDLEQLLYGANGTGVGGTPTNRRFAFNKYYAMDNPGGNTTYTCVLNDLWCFPFTVGRKQSFDRIAAAVVTAATAASGAVLRLGIWDTASNGDPQNLLASMAPSSIEAAGTVQGNIAISINPGLYWLGGVVQVSIAGAPTLRGITAAWSPFVSFDDPANNSSGCGYVVPGQAGALPSPFPVSHANAGIFSGAIPRVMLRAA